MPIKSISSPASSARSLASQKLLSQWLADVAAPVGAQDRPDEVRALTAIHAALDWITHLDWDWYVTVTNLTTTASQASVALPSNLRDLVSVRVSGTDQAQRPIFPIRRDLYNRVRYDQSSLSIPTHYSLVSLGDLRVLELLPTPDQAETLTVTYIRQPLKETAIGNALDISESMEEPLLFRAQGLVGQWRGKEGSWVERMFVLAEQARSASHAQDTIHFDEDIRMISFDEHGTRNWPWTHPLYREYD